MAVEECTLEEPTSEPGALELRDLQQLHEPSLRLVTEENIQIVYNE
jgi:hypothetical protein